MGKLPVALVLAITLLVIPGRAPAAPNFYADAWAVIIGIDDYDVDRIPPVRYAVNDAHSMDFPRERTIVLLKQQATKAGIEPVLGDQLRHQMSSNERLLVFFAGHGKTDRLSAEVLLSGIEAELRVVREQQRKQQAEDEAARRLRETIGR